MPSRNNRIAVLASDSDRVAYYECAEQARRKLADGRLVADTEAHALRIVPGCHAIDARPGSFGIRREHVPVGNSYGLSAGVVFSHQNTYERVAA